MLSLIINSTTVSHAKKLIESVCTLKGLDNLEFIVVCNQIPPKDFCDWVEESFIEQRKIITIYVPISPNIPVSQNLLIAARLAEGDKLWFLTDDFVFTDQNLDISDVISDNRVDNDTPDRLWLIELCCDSSWPNFVISQNLFKCLDNWECNDFYWLMLDCFERLYEYDKYEFEDLTSFTSKQQKGFWAELNEKQHVAKPNYLTHLDIYYYKELIIREIKECQKLVEKCVVNQLACLSA